MMVRPRPFSARRRDTMTTSCPAGAGFWVKRPAARLGCAGPARIDPERREGTDGLESR